MAINKRSNQCRALVKFVDQKLRPAYSNWTNNGVPIPLGTKGKKDCVSLWNGIVSDNTSTRPLTNNSGNRWNSAS